MKMMRNVSCVVLAAGEGTRMKSELPKVLFDICGKTMIEHLLGTIKEINFYKIYIVVGYKSELVKQKILDSSIGKKLNKKIVFVNQEKQLGSGDAVKLVEKYVSKTEKCLVVLSADVPLVSKETLNELITQHWSNSVECTVLSVVLENPYGYGRIVRDISKKFVTIVEEVDATQQQKLIKEVNAGIYVFSLPNLWHALKQITPDNNKGEYYLTDVVKFLSSKQTVVCKNVNEVKGVNTKKDLAEVTEIVRKKILENLMLSGVTIVLPQTVYIDCNTKIEPDTKVLQGCVITNSQIGKNCVIGPYSFISDSKVGNDTEIVYSYINFSEIGNKCSIGPFSRIRPQTKLYDEVKIGNFVEIKKSEISSGTKINHLSYIGDAVIEDNVNVGAGTITCNYDGIKKHKTYVGKNVFIGSNVNLVAPIKIGSNVVIGAGSTVTKDVPKNTLVIARAQEVHKYNHEIIKKLFGD
jgi:bifunctional UDP-N-acetylglucosamine pyrophosphorylase/glucosamine-1-phosphate N-acetyltransferase